MNTDGNYPAMTDAQKKASGIWDKPIQYKTFDVCVSQTLHKDVKVETDDYTPEWDEEDKRYYPNTDDTRWTKAYFDDGHHTPMGLIMVLKEKLQDDLAVLNGKTSVKSYNRNKLEKLIKECSDWIEDEFEIVEE